MAYHTNGTMPQANVPYHQQYAQHPYKHARLDPAVPHFTPNGTELARFAPPTPPNSNMNLSHPSNHVNDMERYMIDTQTKHDTEMARLERRINTTEHELSQTHEMYKRDLQTLQRQIEMIRLQAGPSKNKDDATAAVQSGLHILNPQDVRPEIMLKHFDREIVAQVYLEQAEVAASTARKLRADALGLTGEAGKMEKCNGVLTPAATSEHQARNEKSSRAVEIKAPTTINDNEDEPSSDQIQMETEQIKKEELPWQPLAVRNMPPSPLPSIPPTHTKPLTWEFLTHTLGGTKYSPSYYFISAPKSLLKSRGYWILEAESEPFLPVHPGAHGAKLTPFFNDTVAGVGEAPDETNYLDTPVFISQVGQAGYTYFGQYSQLRFSDRLDHERVLETVPESIRRYWADQLTAVDRPAWVTKALKEHFWPRPQYEGPIPTDSAVATPATAETGASGQSVPLENRVRDALVAYAGQLKQWEHDASVRVNCLTAEGLMRAFAAADAEMEPGLRLWWEYFECVGYEEGFYEWLVAEQVKFEEGKEGGEAAVPGEQEKCFDENAVGDEEEVQILDWEEDAQGNYTAVSRPANPHPHKSVTNPLPTGSTRAPHHPPHSASNSTNASTLKPSVPRINTAVTMMVPTKPITADQNPSSSAGKSTSDLRNGDLAAARAFQATATPAKPRGGGRVSGSSGAGSGGAGKTKGGGTYTPPHQRTRK